MEQQTNHIGDTNKMITAVQWLASQLGKYIIWEEKIIDLVEQAKEMEKENTKKLLEIIMWYDEESDVRPNTEIYNWFKQYYNETYGKE